MFGYSRLWQTLLLAAFVLAASSAFADPNVGQPYTDSAHPGAVLTLETDKARYFLGENVLVHFHVRNTAASPLSMFMGCDWEANERETGFHVTAVDEHGIAVADPAPYDTSMGGLGSDEAVGGGRDIWRDLPIASYLTIDHPGVYTITVSHDPGWTSTPVDMLRTAMTNHAADLHTHAGLPTAVIQLTFVMPSSAQAAQVFTEMRAMPTSPFTTFGRPGAGYRNPLALHYPVYLPLLAEVSKTDLGPLFKEDADAIGAIATPSSTRLLIALMGDPDSMRASYAARSVIERLVDPEEERYARLNGWTPGTDRRLATQIDFNNRSWTRALGQPACERALDLLCRDSPTAKAAGAGVIERVGTPSCLPVVIFALDKLLAKRYSLDRAPFDGDYRDASETCVLAGRYLIARGAILPRVCTTDAQLLIRLAYMCAPPRESTPPGWDALMGQILARPNPALRILALEVMCRCVEFDRKAHHSMPYLTALLGGSDGYFSRQHDLLEQGKPTDPHLRTRLLGMLKFSNSRPDMQFIIADLWQLGARWDAVDALVDNANDRQSIGPAEQALARLTGHPYGENDSELDAAHVLLYKTKWRAFIDKHKAEIVAGTTFRSDAPEVKALFPPSLR